MGFWKDLGSKVSQKKEELEEEAKKRAAKHAQDLAIETGKAAARSAVKNAGKTLDFAGKKLGEALFGPSPAEDTVGEERAPADPFAKLKAQESDRKAAAEKDKVATEAARKEARIKAEREVDDEIAALKKKIRGK